MTLLRSLLWCSFLALCSPSLAADHDTWQATSSQIVLVLTDRWESTSGKMLRLERGADGWERLENPGAVAGTVTVGKKGLGLGLGLHPAGLKGPQKREGDKRAPAGIFHLESGFGTAAMVLPSFPYRETTATDFWVDDSKSRFYNQWVNTADPQIRRDWKSAEVLRRSDGVYDAVIVVAHNRGPVISGRGSAIFMHSWYAPGVATIGCTAMEKSRILALLQWLDRSKNPVLIQAPLELLPQLRLPEAVSVLVNSR